MNQYENEYIGDLLYPGPEIYSTKEEIEQEITNLEKEKREIRKEITNLEREIWKEIANLERKKRREITNLERRIEKLNQESEQIRNTFEFHTTYFHIIELANTCLKTK